jgi:hypothetical protein
MNDVDSNWERFYSNQSRQPPGRSTGVVSFVLSLFSALTVGICLAISLGMSFYPGLAMFVVSSVVGGCMSAVAFILGITGLRRGKSGKGFALAGTILSVATLVFLFLVYRWVEG